MKKKNSKKNIIKEAHFKDGLIAIHGRNIQGYITELTDEVKEKFDERLSKSKEEALGLSTDDMGNADYFLHIFGKYVLYDNERREFYYWTGRLWRKDQEMRVQLWIQISMERRREIIHKALKKNPDIKNAGLLQRHAQRCCNQHGINSVLELIKSRIGKKVSDYNRNKHLVNVLNGTIDLRTKTLSPHNKEDYITMMIPVVYDPNSESELFKEFLEKTFQSNELIHYVKKMFGSFLSGETKEQSLYFAYGNGANGKSTLLSLVRYIMNDYATVIPAKVLTGVDRGSAPTPELAELPHKRLVCCSELNCNDMLNEGKIKIMSSGDTLPARPMFGHPFRFEPEFKLVIDTNYLPDINGTDWGIWRRINIIPFNYTVPKKEINVNLLEDLKKHSKAVLAWMIEGAELYYKEGLEAPGEIQNSNKEYRKSQDTLGQFLTCCVEKCDGSEVRARDFYHAYINYCSENFLKPISETKFGRDLSVKGCKRGKDRISRKYVDIRLISTK